jgi:hypothetical protein
MIESRRENLTKFIQAIQNAKNPGLKLLWGNKVLHAPISGTPDAGADVGFGSWWAFSSFIYADIDFWTWQAFSEAEPRFHYP